VLCVEFSLVSNLLFSTDFASSESSNQSCASDDSDTLEDKSNSNPKTNGVFWDGSHWAVETDCSQNVVPFDRTEQCHLWSRSRLTSERNTYVDCVPEDACTSCCVSLSSFPKTLIGTIKVHTYAGTVERNLFQIICKCGYRNQWNPQSECIHTIRNGQHGGENI
jgi:hypothetical protein